MGVNRNPESKAAQTPKRTSLGKKPSAASAGSSSVMSAWLTRTKKPEIRKGKGLGADAPPGPGASTAAATLAQACANSTKSPRKRASEVKTTHSPAKQRAILKSPAQDKHYATSFDSPVKTKSSSRVVDSPVKTKSSSRVVDSPAKTKFSSRFVDSPLKTKLMSKSSDSPVKTKSSSRILDSPLKTKSDIYSFDSPKRPKLSRKETDSTSFTCAASPARPKTSPRTRTPSKRDIKESTTPEKSTSSNAISSESRGRPLRSTPSKTAQCSLADVLTEEKHEKTEAGKLGGKGSIASWLSANKCCLSSPAKRSLNGAFKGVASNPARRSKASASSKTKKIGKDEPVLKSVPQVDWKSPELLEAPKKKARIGSSPQKKTAQEGKKRSSSETARKQKNTSGGPSQSKDHRKKSSPRGKAAMKTKSNDKSQTFLTSHFFVVSPKAETKVKPVIGEPSGDVSEPKAVLAPSTKDNHFVQTSPSMNSTSSQFGITVADTNDVIDCEMPLACPSIEECGNEESFVPVTSDAQGNSQVSMQADDPPISAVVTEERRVSAEDVSEELPITCDSSAFAVSTKQPVTLDVGGEQGLGNEEPRSTSGVRQEQLTAEDETLAAMSHETTTPGTVLEPRINEHVNDEASVNSSQEGISTLHEDHHQPIQDDSYLQNSGIPLVSEEQSISVNSVEERSDTPLVSKEQLVSVESAEESSTPPVREELPISVDSSEKRSVTPLVREEPSIPVDSSEERSATPLVKEELPISVHSSEERSSTPLVREELPISVDSS